MNGTDEVDLEKSLQCAQRVCRAIRNALTVCVVLFVIGWVIALIAVAAVCIGQGPRLIGYLMYLFAYGTCIALFLLTMVQIFAEVVRGGFPFSEKQANRLRLTAILLLCLFLVDILFSAGISFDAIPSIGYSIGINDAYPTGSVNLNVGMLAFSAIMYSLSALFRYAALMQQLVNDTV